MPAELTPSQLLPVIVITFAICRTGLMAPLLVRITVGSSTYGTANPPAVVVREAARDSASSSSRVRGLPASAFPNARL